MRVPLQKSLIVALLTTATALAPRSTLAQTLTDVLSFLLTNRSIPTDDFERDKAAAGATRDAISIFLLTELGTLPVSASSGGFTYRIEPTLGTSLRSSDSFGPFFSERSLTSGARQISVGVSWHQARYRTIDGRNLRDGTLVAVASQLRNETQPFDIETLMLRLRADTLTVQANVGVRDRLDIGVSMPFLRLVLEGERVDTYRGRRSVQALATGSSSGPGDLLVRAKYNVMRYGASGVAVGVEGRLPTGDKQNLLGSGEATIAPRGIVSFERSRASAHGTAGYTVGGLSNAIDLAAAGTVVATPRLTVVGELAGRRLSSTGRLVEVSNPHPTLANVQTVRLTTIDAPTVRVVMLAGLKWNVTSTWLLNLSLVRPLSEAGLNAGWAPTITFDRSFGR